MIGTTEIALIAGVAVLLFGVDKLPKLARGMGQAKKEFMVGQAEADIAAEQAREEARRRVAAPAGAMPPNPVPPGNVNEQVVAASAPPQSS